ncbi:MAG: glycosyl hydrolase 108 family protein [Sphingomicrobium sp.]
MPIPGRVLGLIAGVIEREGDYVNHPNDPGGPTRYGITERIARASGYGGDMRTLPVAVAQAIYLDQYYEGPGFDRVARIMPDLAEELVDTGVNMGPAVAAAFLQRALTALNRQGRDYPDLKPDGRLGPVSAGALLAFKQKRGGQAETVLLRLVESFQGTRYVEICEARPASEDFLFGWIVNRIGNVL